MTKPEAQPEAPQQYSAQQCFQWARSGHNALSVLLTQADAFVPAAHGMDGDTADAISEALAQAKSALATAYGVFHLAAQAQPDPNARYAPAQQQSQYVTGGTGAWAPQ